VAAPDKRQALANPCFQLANVFWLLRNLLTKAFERLGEYKSTNLTLGLPPDHSQQGDLQKGVTAGGFQADRQYRLNVFFTHVLPLREYWEDILLFACPTF
jgi:transcriptional regulator with GAF, ATPase, and Fis domain